MTTTQSRDDISLPLNPKSASEATGTIIMDCFNSEEFGKRAEELMKEWHAPGLAAAIVHEQTVSSRAWGMATLDPPRQCTADTLFDIASSSKSMTAASVGLLVEDNDRYPDVQWDAVMNKLLPDDFVMSRDEYTQSVTVEDILSHRSGLPTHDASYMGINAARPDNAQSITRNLRNLPIVAPLRTKFMYCNLLFTVATHLVEKYSEMTFEDFLHKHFFGPLEMESSHLQPEGAKRAGLQERVALPCEWKENEAVYVQLPPEQAPEAQGAGSIYTSVNDYIKYVKAMINQEGPITKELFLGLTRMRTIVNADMDQDFDPLTSAEFYAVGWEVFWYRGWKVIKHDGLIAGFASMHFFLPDLKFGGVLLSNSDGGGSVIPVLMRELVDEVLQVPQAARPDWNARQRASEERYRRQLKEQYSQVRKELCPEQADGVSQPQKVPLSSYVGEYWNAGYQRLEVQIKNDTLYINGSDRSNNGLEMTFEHICNQTQYVVYLTMSGPGEAEELKGEFRFKNDEVVNMGIQLEPELDDLIWFDKVR